MGAWGPALFSDDDACDVRDRYRELIEDGVEDAEATRQILDEFSESVSDPDTGPVIWLALAVSQSRLGRLDPAVASRALQIIAAGEGLAQWEEQGPKMLERRKAALAKVDAQLTGPQPPRRKVRPPRATSLQPGDVLAYRTRDGIYVLLRVVRIHRGEPVVVLLDYTGPVIPPLHEIAKLGDHHFVDGNERQWHSHVAPMKMSVYKRIDYHQAGYVLVGNIGPREGEEQLEVQVLIDWQDYLPGFGVVSQILQGGPRLHRLPRVEATAQGL